MSLLKWILILILLAGVTLFVMSEFKTTEPASLSGEYFVDQANLYFDTLDFSSWLDPSPSYSVNVIRWEHPPWLKLTGYGKTYMTTLDKLQTLYPTYVTGRVCTAHDSAPQARCHVSFKYIGLPYATQIYEEFTFNKAGEITFIEAWTDTPEVSAMANADTIARLSTDRSAADLVMHLKHPIYYWFRELLRWF